VRETEQSPTREMHRGKISPPKRFNLAITDGGPHYATKTGGKRKEKDTFKRGG